LRLQAVQTAQLLPRRKPFPSETNQTILKQRFSTLKPPPDLPSIDSQMCSTALPSTFHYFPPSPTHISCGQSQRLPFPASQNIRLPRLVAAERALSSGLRTPPADTMSTTYQAPLSNYDNHVPAYSLGLAQAVRANTALGDGVRQPYSQHTAQYYSHPPSQGHLRNNPSSGSSQHITTSRHSTRPSTPTSSETMAASRAEGASSRRGSHAVSVVGTQIPAIISPNGGSISDFAAEVRTGLPTPPCSLHES
jgi:hypothetical protein